MLLFSPLRSVARHLRPSVSVRARRPRRGITLLEMVLSLGLLSLLLIGITMAIDVQWRVFERRRTFVQEAQLGRAVLRQMANDLHSAIQYEPFDDSGGRLASRSSSQSSELEFDGDEDDMLDAMGFADEAFDDEFGDGGFGEMSIASSTTPAVVPGLYGTATELQVDISRLPRMDEYHPEMMALTGAPVDIASDVKTVAYYLSGENVLAGPMGLGMPEGLMPLDSPGLIRRQMDRAVALWAAESGMLAAWDFQGELMAPEVAGLAFEYFDGWQWYTFWDSGQMGGLPQAVRIMLALRPLEEAGRDVVPDQILTMEDLESSGFMMFELVVHLPMAKPMEADTSMGMDPFGF